MGELKAHALPLPADSFSRNYADHNPLQIAIAGFDPRAIRASSCSKCTHYSSVYCGPQQTDIPIRAPVHIMSSHGRKPRHDAKIWKLSKLPAHDPNN